MITSEVVFDSNHHNFGTLLLKELISIKFDSTLLKEKRKKSSITKEIEFTDRKKQNQKYQT